LHVGNCCQNGVTAALLAKEGLTASSEALDGDLGFCKAFAGAVNHDKIIGRLGSPYDIIDPGILFKLYPSCAETHTALDATISLAQQHNIQPEDVLSVPCIVTPLNYDVLIYSSPLF
ncbi:MAG: MmgE/PrpD family protein, partial [Deltaproteobacteria bacterium]|nr:MmgE/PrpD family protein [Deltaproteobacteria bacterium]